MAGNLALELGLLDQAGGEPVERDMNLIRTILLQIEENSLVPTALCFWRILVIRPGSCRTTSYSSRVQGFAAAFLHAANFTNKLAFRESWTGSHRRDRPSWRITRQAFAQAS